MNYLRTVPDPGGDPSNDIFLAELGDSLIFGYKSRMIDRAQPALWAYCSIEAKETLLAVFDSVADYETLQVSLIHIRSEKRSCVLRKLFALMTPQHAEH